MLISLKQDDNTMQTLSELQTGKVWRPITATGLKALQSQSQNNLVQKAVTTAAAASDTTTAAGDPPLQILSVSAVESPSKQQDRTYSEVSVSFTRNTADPNFGSVKVWFIGYQGSATPTLMTDGATSPITFLVESTGETVTVKAQAVSSTGLTADLGTAPSTTVALDGVVSAPPAPTVTQSLLTTPVGYQFQFAYEGGLLADVIQSYNIYRNTSNTTSGATLVKNVPQPATNSGSYVYQEAVPNGTTYFYFVSAVNTSALESSLTAAQAGTVINTLGGNSGGINQLQNPSFETPATVGSGDLVAGWSIVAQSGPYVATVQNAISANTGNSCIESNITGSQVLANGASWTLIVRNRQQIPAVPGQQWTLSGYVKPTISGLPAGVTASIQLQVRQNYSDGSSDFSAGLFTGNLSSFSQSSYTKATAGPVTIPTPVGKNLSYLSYELTVTLTNSSGSSKTINSGTMNAGCFFDDVSLVKTADLDAETSDGSSRFAQTASGLSYRPISNPLTATDAGSNATISIASFTMRTSSKGDVAISSGSVTALSYSTLYYIYYDDANLAGGGVSYNATTTKTTALNGAGRFYVGSIFTPNAGGTSTTGYNDGGTGAQAGKSLIGGPGSQAVTTAGSSVPSFSVFGNSMSGDQSQFDVLSTTGTSNTKSLTYVLSNFGFSNQNYTTLSLNVKSALPTNGLNGTGAKWVISYSLNGGVSFNPLRSQNAGTTYSVTTDTVNLDLRQNLAAVQVKYVMQLATTDTTGTITANIYTPQISGTD